jgi:hypothetical protein
LPIFDNDNIYILELMEALETECGILKEAGMDAETQEIKLSDKNATVISDMLETIYDPMDIQYRKTIGNN